MKPVYLEFSGINSFTDKVSIDFSRLLAGGLFGIFGDTGSGKSTILDAIHLALYNKSERASGSIGDCINHHSEKAVVTFDFEIVNDGARNTYRVHRERGRKPSSVKANLYRLQDGKWFALAEGTSEVDGALSDIIGLTFDEFKKCIALPQGEFAGLVKAGKSERIALMSHLFGLEKYGETLRKYVASRAEEIVQTEKEITARMEENEGGRVEVIEECANQITLLKGRRAGLDDEIKVATERVELLKKQQAAKREYDDLTAELERKENERSVYEEKRSNYERVAGATRVKEKAENLEKTQNGLKTARLQAERAELAAQEAHAEWLRLNARLEELCYDEKIEAANKSLAKAEFAEKDRKALDEAERQLCQLRKQFKEIKDKYPEDDYDGKIAAIDKAIEELGDVSYAEFLKDNLKDVLLAETYGEIRFDLSTIQEQFPETEEVVSRLKEKYTLAQSGDEKSFDIADVKLKFEQIKKQRETLSAQKSALEKTKREYERNELEKEKLAEKGKLYAEQAQVLRAKLQEVENDGTVVALKAKINQLKAEKLQDEKGVETAREKHAASVAENAKQRAVEESLAAQEKELALALGKALKEEGFEDKDEAIKLLILVGDPVRAKGEFENFFARFEAVKSRLKDISKESFEGFSEEAIVAALDAAKTLDNERLNLVAALSVEEERFARLNALREKYLELKKEKEGLEKQRKLWEQLRSLTAKNKFMEFIASEYLQDVCLDASDRLLKMTGNRYFLRYETEFMVGDNFDGGNLRAVRTLSGGETFLVSLSLALSLSNAIFSRSMRPIEFFFLDEGFGTLDGKLVDTVMDVLGKLSKNFAVGLISHVDELKTRIENKILVSAATETRGSTIKTETYA